MSAFWPYCFLHNACLRFLPGCSWSEREADILRVCSTEVNTFFFDVLLTVRLSIFISVINQLDAQSFSFTISIFHASTFFEHMWSSSGGQNCIT